MITFKAHQRLGDLVISANSLTLTAIKADNRDDSPFIKNLKYPSSLEKSIFIDDFSIETDIDAISVYSLCGNSAIVNNSIYGVAFIPDWVDVDIGEENTKELSTVPSIEDITNEITDELYLFKEKFAVTDSICSKTDWLGISQFTLKMTASAYVEHCNKTNCFVEDMKVYDLDAITTTVTADMDITIEGNTSSTNNVKTMKFVCNKNNYIDLFIDLDGILEIKNLPIGLSYKNKHISGTPIKSGSYTSTIKFDPNIIDSADYIIRFSIPELQRLK